jgi:acetyl-CoA acetyltransferase
MRVVWYERKGPAREVLQHGELPTPEPGAGEVRVRVHASGINPSDTKNRSGWGGNTAMPFPRVIPHQDGAGVIDAVGAGVPAARVGERVWVYEAQLGRPFGTAAEWVVVPAEKAVRLPAGTDFAAGACLGVPAMTAHYAVFADGPVQGQTILVTGGAGAVGNYAVQWANIAAKYGFTRDQQDEFALASHKKAAKAMEAGYFKSQIVPIELKTRKGVEQFTTDEHVRPAATRDDLAKLKTVFKKDGTVTAGNASGINDAGAALVLMEAKTAKDLKPMARLVAYAHAGVEPQVMGLGPIPAVKRVFEKAGLKPSDMDVVESNEAFAVQAMAVTKDLGLDPAKVNPNGGAVALGHPIGATGAILAVKALYELERAQKRYALVTMCIGGGQGIAAIFERL